MGFKAPGELSRTRPSRVASLSRASFPIPQHAELCWPQGLGTCCSLGMEQPPDMRVHRAGPSGSPRGCPPR